MDDLSMEEIIYPENVKNSLLMMIQKNIDALETTFNIEIALRGNKLMFEGETADKRNFKKFIENYIAASKNNGKLHESDFKIGMSMADQGKIHLIKEELNTKVILKVNDKEVYPRTINQKTYIQAVIKNDLTFGIGPAGTGKTFLAIATALNFLSSKQVERIVLTRPVVEAGEKLGFLPGDIYQKVNPYFRPLYDALYYLIGFEKTTELIDKEVIEIAPLAYMRGRTINNAFIILDEGQNTLNSQMKMFLTRFGQNSKVIVTADISQIDLAEPNKSGIFNAIKILKNIKGIAIVYLNEKDVVRHHLVKKIIEAYERKKNET
jgi:phosphate starvation-inducible PhoH-like protein